MRSESLHNTTQTSSKAADDASLLVENGGDQETLFVARFLLRPPHASLKSGGGGSCVQRGTSTTLLEELPWLCVTGGAYALLKERCEMHPPYGRSCYDELVYLAAIVLPIFSGIKFIDLYLKTAPPPDDEKSPAAGLAMLCIMLGSLWFSHVLRYRMDQRSMLRSLAVQAFHSDLQNRVTRLAKRCQPAGFLFSTKERDGGMLDVVIEKSCGYDGECLLPSTNASRAKNMLSELDIKSVRFDKYYLTANTPLDIWLVGGLMLYRARTNNRNRDWETIIDRMSPLLQERLGYTMNYELRRGWLPNTTKGTIQFQDTLANDALCPTKESTALHVTRRTTRSSNAQVETV